MLRDSRTGGNEVARKTPFVINTDGNEKEERRPRTLLEKRVKKGTNEFKKNETEEKRAREISPIIQ